MRLAALVALLFAACTPRPFPPNEPDVVIFDGASAGTPCQRACSALVAAACPEGSPTRAGVTCEQVCESASAERLMDPECVAASHDVGALHACNVRCQQ